MDLGALEEKVEELDLSALEQDQTFVTTTIQGSRIALSTHQKEKIDALRNAILNSALPGSPDENLQSIFLGLVDDFTIWHIYALDEIPAPDDPHRSNLLAETHENQDPPADLELLRLVEPDRLHPPPEGYSLEDNFRLTTNIKLELMNRGLIQVVTREDRRGKQYYSIVRSRLGCDFMRFIESPLAAGEV